MKKMLIWKDSKKLGMCKDFTWKSFLQLGILINVDLEYLLIQLAKCRNVFLNKQ